MLKNFSFQKSSLLIFWGIILGLISFLSLLFFQNFINYMIKTKMTLKEDSELFDRWINISMPFTFRVYIFEVTNPTEVWQGLKPKLRERGPYTFSEKRHKNVIKRDTEKSTITYLQYRKFYFDQLRSAGRLSDIVTIANVPVVTMTSRMEKFLKRLPVGLVTKSLIQVALNTLFRIHHQHLFINVSVEDYIFKGYTVNVLETIQAISRPLKILGANYPIPQLVDNKFGLFYPKNTTSTGPFEIYTDSERLGQIRSWKFQETLNHWPGVKCNVLKGSDGTLFPPFVDKSKLLHIFVDDLCRSIYLKFKKESMFKGFRTYKFELPEELFWGTLRNSENVCFCNSDQNMCHKDGLVYLGPCRFGAPLYLSKPHFLHGFEKLVSDVEGISPKENAHSSYIEIEPTLGIPMRAYMRLGINIDVKRFPLIQTLNNVIQETIYPIAWFEQSAELSDEFVNDIKAKVVRPVKIGKIILSLFCLIGIMLLAIGLIIRSKHRTKSGKIGTNKT